MMPFINRELLTPSDGPGVTLDCVFVTGVRTPLAYKFKNDDFSDGGKVHKRCEGDGVVPRMSAEGPLKSWAANASHRVTGYPLDIDVVHHAVVWAPEAISVVVNVLRATQS